MPEGKWTSDLSPELPLSEAARLVLPTRLHVVLTQLPQAVSKGAKDPEYVHRLRVATRRAAAALRLFEDCLPRKHERTIRRSLQAVRRKAGAARDWDVFREMLQKAPPLQPAIAKAARDFLFGFQTARRFDAQAQLAEVMDAECEKLERETRKLDGPSFEWHESNQSTGAYAVERIGSLMKDFEGMATPPPASYEDLHRLRILGKRLRYSMEVFAECFEAPLRERLYPAIEEMQETLGNITDAHVATDRFVEIREHVKAFQPADWPRYRMPIERLLQAQRSVLPRERKLFMTWLRNWRKLTAEFPLDKLAK
jgi:CHAD domain-containing protein